MRRAGLVVVLLFAVGAGAARKPCPAPLWTIDLAGNYGFRPFAAWESGWLRPEGLQTRQGLKSVWEPQQGVVFISPKMLAVYQVLATDLPPLAGRDASGGGGKFILQVVLLDTTRGGEVRTFRLTTGGSDLSEVYPTYDGKFLIRTGQIMRLYSSDFEEIASRPLPLLSGTYRQQGWGVSVSPSGRLIYEKYILYAFAPSESTIIKRILLDADTLEVIPNPRLSDVALWPGGASLFNDRVVFVPSDFIDGVYTPDGKWQTFDGGFNQYRDCHGVAFARVSDQIFARYGCKHLKLFSPDGQLFWHVPVREEVFSVRGNGNLLAVRTAHSRWDPLDLGLGSKPLHIVLYDLATKSEKCSIHTTKLPYYAVSRTGAVAVIQGTELSLYHP